jgi:hypothetical protein
MSSSAELPLALSAGPGQKAFPQSGSWNMLDLSKLPVQATLGVLSRYSAARVNPYTALVGEVLCHNFQLTTKGRRNLEVAVNELKVVGSLGDTLEFGFGIEDVVRSMAKSERGCVCLALCAAMKDCYSEDMAVEVLLEMANLAKVDGQYMPSSQSWKELLNACAGTLSTSKFPLLAEHFMRMNQGEERLGAYQRLEGLPKVYRSCSSPKSIAEALLALAKISRGEMQGVTLVGGADVGWLAAIAEWLLDLRIQIIRPGGELFYTNCSTTDTVQVQVMDVATNGSATNSVRTVGKTYYLDDVSQLFQDEGRSPDATVVSGRVNWKNLLGSTFGSDFKKLMEKPHSVGELFGSAAWMFKALALADKSIPERYRLACTSYCDSSYGSGFVSNMLRWFPELQQMKATMQTAASVDMATARRTYEACISTLRSHCDCKTCNSAHCHPNFEEDAEMTPAPDDVEEEYDGSQVSQFDIDSDDAEAADDWDPDRFCAVIMVETIISLSRTLSNVIIENESLFPVRSGVELAYGRQLNQRRAAHSGKQAVIELGPIAFCLDFDNNFSFGVQQGNEEGVEIRLQSILELFAGRRAPSTSSSISALCVNGVCAFLDVLRKPDDDRNSVACIHVLPGRILHEKKSYSRLIDRVVRQDDDTDWSTAIKFAASEELETKTSLSVRESSSGLECLLEMEITFGIMHDAARVAVGPSHLSVLLASRRGLISCKLTKELSRPSGRRCSMRSTGDLDQAMIERIPREINGKSILLLRCGETEQAIAVLASMAHLDPMYSVYIVDKECIDCCLKAALAVDRLERSHFCFLVVSA